MPSDESHSLSQPSTRRRMYEHRNSLLPNDPGLNGAGSSASIDRRNSNESDESDNLSQYFRSSPSRKSSLMTGNDLSTAANTDVSPERNASIVSAHDEAAAIASRRLQSFLQSSNEKRPSKDSNDLDFSKFKATGQRRSSSALGSFKFLKKKTKSMDSSEPVRRRFARVARSIERRGGLSSFSHPNYVKMIMLEILKFRSDITVTENN